MADTKKTLPKIILFLFLVLFPFGQILRLKYPVFGFNLPVLAIDLVAALAFFYLLRVKISLPLISKEAFAFILILVFSLLFSLGFFNFKEILVGILYFFRLLFYFSLFLITWDLTKDKENLRKLIYNCLIAVLVFAAIFGWIQYFLYPDIRSFTVWGWDDHLFRLTGTFFDPGFMSILIVFGFLLTLAKFFRTKDRKLLVLLLFFFISLGFTYSRAGFIALLTGATIILILHKKIWGVAILILTLTLMILLLPRPGGEGVKLERISSISLRFKNYRETLQIWQKNPVFGVGYNNLCVAKSKILGKANHPSHSCSGSDSSLLGLLAASGVFGLISFFVLVKKIIRSLAKDSFKIAIMACLSALFTHSLFVNSLFYPWVMGLMGVLLAISLRREF